MKKNVIYIVLALVTDLLTACASLPDYEKLDQPYDRIAICQRIELLLEDHHKNQTLSAANLKKLFDDYKIYGCDK